MNPELSYLLSGRAQGVTWGVSQVPLSYDTRYENTSDRWNVLADVGVGTGWSVAGRPASIEVRYMSEINTMTRSIRPPVAPAQQNIGWTKVPGPYYTSEYRSHAVELVMGYSW